MYLLLTELSYAPGYSCEEIATIDDLVLAIRRCYQSGTKFRIAQALGINFDIVPVEETLSERTPEPEEVPPCAI